MKKKLLTGLQVFVLSFLFGQDMISFQDRFETELGKDSSGELKSWLESNKDEYGKYMIGCPRNLVTVAYEKGKVDIIPTLLAFDPKLLSIFIDSCAGCHFPEPPTVFRCVMKNDLKATKFFLDAGFPIDIEWGRIGSFPTNLLSASTSPEMTSLLLQYGAKEFQKLNDYDAVCIDRDVRVRESPSLTATIKFKVNKGTKGMIDQTTSKRDWYHIRFEDGTEGWSFAKFYDIPSLRDGC